MSNNQLPITNNLLNERASTALAALLVCLMLVCAVVPLVGLGERVAPAWNGGYLLPAAFVSALEAVLSWRAARRYPFPGRQWFLYRATEIIVLLVGLRLYLYLVRGWAALLADLSHWRENIGAFLGGEYLFALVLLSAVWMAATHFASILADLEGDADLLALERDSRIESDRAGARRRLIADIFIIGGVMLFFTALLRYNLAFLGLPTPPLQTGLLNVVIYFLLGLVLLAQSQFAVLRARWMIDRIPVQPALAPRWAVYSAALLLVCAVLVIFLPTRYSLGFLDTIAAFLSVFQIVLALLLYLIAVLINSLLAIFGRSPALNSPAPQFDLDQAAAGNTASGLSWLDALSSIAFWIIFIAVIAFSLYYYLRSRADLLSKFPRLRFPKLHFKFPRLRLPYPHTPTLPHSPFRFLSLRRLSPRDRVRFYYFALLRRADIPRQPSQTPYEYQQTLSHLPPGDLSPLTEAFVEAQYSRHEISATLASRIKTHWENLKRVLRSRRRS